MKLQKILEQLKTEFKIAFNQDLVAQIEVKDMVIDSRFVKNGDVFFALKGLHKDGIDYAESAVGKGAKVLVISSQSLFNINNFKQLYPETIIIVSDNNFLLLVEFLQIFYQPLPKNIYGITGTNGKTSTVEYIRQILKFLNINSASIGTLGINCDQQHNLQFAVSSLTTPDIVALYKNLYLLKQSNIDDVAIEVSSIGLDQNRLAGIAINCAGFTNFTQDHLDYHQTMENYLLCKIKLFEQCLVNHGFAVLNSDIEEFAKIKKICDQRKIKIIDYGFSANIFKIKKIAQQQIFFQYRNQEFVFEMSANGDFQAFNLLCALALVVENHQLTSEQIVQILKKFSQIKTALGRMQKIAQLKNNAQIFIDFAHSPDALKNILMQAQKMLKTIVSTKSKPRRLIVLFGCGGDRDRQKRPIMGKIACQLADLVIISDDNPRSEDAKVIRQEILAGCNLTKTIEIADRQNAIIQTLAMLEQDDILILAGKGHEKYQIIGDKKIAFDEEQIVKNALK